jgi:hypothetical protein
MVDGVLVEGMPGLVDKILGEPGTKVSSNRPIRRQKRNN